MFCPSCGAENEDGAQFCSGCGANMTAGASESSASEAEAPPPPTPPPPPESGEAPPPPPPSSGKGEIDLGGWIGKGFSEVMSDIGGYIVIGLVVGLVGGFTLGILMGPLMAGAYYVIRRKLAGKGKLDVGEVFSKGMSVFLPSFLLVWVPIVIIGIIGMIPVVGAIVGIVVGGLLFPLYSLGLHYIMEEKQDFMPAGKAAWEIIKTNIFMFWVLGIVTGIVAGIGSIACGIGVIFTMPVGLVMMAYMMDEFLPLKS